MELNDIPTPETDRCVKEIDTHNWREWVVREKLENHAINLERRLAVARAELVRTRGFVEAVCDKTMGPDYKSSTLEALDTVLKQTAPKS